MSAGADALAALAGALAEERTPVSPHLGEAPPQGPLGDLAAAAAPPASAAEYAFVVESIREGYLLHYGRSRLLAGHDEDLALLAGDYLYALGLDRLAKLGDDRAVLALADLISACARLHAEGHGAQAEELWRQAVAALR